MSVVFVKILKVSYTFCIDYSIFVSYVKLCCVFSSNKISACNNFPSYRMKAWRQTVKCVAALNLGWFVKGITFYHLCKDREICTDIFKVLALSPQEMKGLVHSDIVWRVLNGGCKNRIRNLSHSCFELHYFFMTEIKNK